MYDRQLMGSIIVLLDQSLARLHVSDINFDKCALTLAVGWAAGRAPGLSGGCWRGYLSGARCRLAYGPADTTATHCLLFQKNPDWFYLSGTGSLG